MILSIKQKRIFTLAVMLSSGESVSANTIIKKADCSGATLTRALRDIRDAYNATIKYSKSSHSYQITDAGNLTHVEIAQMRRALSKAEKISENEIVSLTKVRKKAVSISLSKATISKLDRLANEKKLSRSDIIEMLINSQLTLKD
ncbi:ribbon-helix-helix protein, CopG family [Shewanella morhuae]|uniref:Ribbon-helix-helix protein, copG family n=1 Tax=Shewanella morhuae TaxID=365591 RepID=A0A380BXT8_9GAMM|nr:ribbon-helix-helix protein, CopG family [Shewanella morhuae]SUJ08631.1 Ribbon-helix-helix protein, copG family [Shewanella morhuae]